MAFFIRFFIIPLSLAFLTACGGSGGGVGVIVNSAEAVKGFSDDFGLIQLKNAGIKNGGYGYVLIESPAMFINALDGDVAIENTWNTRPVSRNSGYAAVRENAFIESGISVNAAEYRDYTEISAIRYGRYSDGSLWMLQTIGDNYGSAPIGSLRYKGTLVMFDRNTNFSRQEGLVTVNVNFSDRAFDLNGETAAYSISGSGYVDTNFGTLSSSNSTVRVSGVNKNASINGSLHGTNASGVSGVIYTSGSTPRYTGAFAGAKR